MGLGGKGLKRVRIFALGMGLEIKCLAACQCCTSSLPELCEMRCLAACQCMMNCLVACQCDAPPVCLSYALLSTGRREEEKDAISKDIKQDRSKQAAGHDE